MCLFTNARTVVIVFARSAGSEAMYCAGVLTFGGGFMTPVQRRVALGASAASIGKAALPERQPATTRHTVIALVKAMGMLKKYLQLKTATAPKQSASAQAVM